MVTHDRPGDGWTAVLRRRPACIVDGRTEDRYTDDAFEIICCDCGHDPGRDGSLAATMPMLADQR